MEKLIISEKNYEDKNVFFKLYESICKSKKLKPLDKLIYTIMRNRLNLSIENNIKNEDGEYYIYYAQEEISEFINCSVKSVINSFERLRENNLIRTEQQKNNSLKIYFFEIECKKYEDKKIEDIKKNTEDNKKIEDINTHEKISGACEKISEAPEKKSYNKDKQNNNNKIINNNNNITSYHINHNKIDSIDKELKDTIENYQEELKMLKEQINYNDLITINKTSKENIDEIIYICMDMLTSEYTLINKQQKPFCIIKSVLKRLTFQHIQEILEKFNSISTKINNVKGYIKTMIYNSCISYKANLTNQVNYDMYSI